MSLGGEGYYDNFVDPLQNTLAAGVLPVSASGNDDEGTSGSPGNLYDGLAIGASDESEDIASFSSGELIDTDEDWGDDAPDHWPSEYIVPDVAAPGVSVLSAVPGDDYDEMPGTSMAAPHVAGVAGLLVSASGGEVTPDEIVNLLEEYAWKPDGWDPDVSIGGKDTRYGKGIIDAKAAVDQVALDSGIEGTVTDASDSTALEGVPVEIEDGPSVTTDEDGEYEMLASPDTYTVTANTFGYAEQSHSVSVTEDEFTTQNFSLDRELDGRVLVAQQGAVEGGDSVETTVEAAHADTLTVTQLGNYDEADANLVVDGDESATFDDPVSIDGGFTEVPITVETAADTEGEITLEVTLGDGDGSVPVDTGSTTVFEELVTVGLVGNAHLDDVEATLEAEFPSFYDFSELSDADEAGEYDVLVVQSLTEVDSADFVTATDDDETGVVYLDQWGSDSNGIPDYAEIADDEVTDTFEDDSFEGGVDDPIYYEPTADHPILDGFDVGETVLIHDGQYGDVTWFESEGYDVIAAVHDDSGEIGSGLAVKDETRTVLASSLGYTQYVGDDEYTADADTILANAVEYALPEGEVEFSVVLSDVTGVSPGGSATIAIDGGALTELTIHDLWLDWDVDDVEAEGASVPHEIDDDGQFTFAWGEPTGTVNPSLTVDLKPRYVGGTFRMTVTASGEEESFEGTVDLEIEAAD